MNPANSSPCRWNRLGWGVAVVLLLVEGGKLIWLERAGPAPVIYDAAGYWQLGTQVAGGDLWMTADPIGYRTPGYPWWLGFCQWLCGSSAWRAVSILQHLCVFITTGLTAWWTWRLTSRVWLVNLSLMIRVLSVGSASYAETLLTETVYLPVLTLIMILLTTSCDIMNWRTWCVICVLWSLSFLIRPSSVALLPVLGLALALPVWPTGFSRVLIRRLASRLVVGAVIAAVLIGPWCVRNAMIFGRPTPVIFLGRELWISILGPGRPAAPALPDTPEMQRIRELTAASPHEIPWENNWSVSHALTDAGLTDAQADDLQRTVAVQALSHDPLRAVLRISWKVLDFWRVVYDREQALYGDQFTPENMPKGQSMWGQEQQREQRTLWLSMAPEHQLLVMELGSLLGLFGTVGLCLSPRYWRSGLFCLATLALFCGITAALDAPTYRYRMILEPLLIVGGSAGFTIWWQVVRLGTHLSWKSARTDPESL